MRRAGPGVAYDDCLGELDRRGLLPPSWVAVFASGSAVRQWDNEGSDFDLFVICDQPWTGPSARSAPVALQPDSIRTEVTFVGKRRWDVKYWLDAQIDQLLRKASWAEFDTNESAPDLITRREMDFLERLSYSRAIAGEAWLRRRRKELEESALHSMVVSRELKLVDLLLEDAIGQLTSGDQHSAVLSAREAFGHVVDALLASHRQLGQRGKWRARRLLQCAQRTLSFEEYWQVETMREFDPAEPGRWVERVVLLCRRIMLDVVV